MESKTEKKMTFQCHHKLCEIYIRILVLVEKLQATNLFGHMVVIVYEFIKQINSVLFVLCSKCCLN